MNCTRELPITIAINHDKQYVLDTIAVSLDKCCSKRIAPQPNHFPITGLVKSKSHMENEQPDLVYSLASAEMPTGCFVCSQPMPGKERDMLIVPN